jgi:CRISPR/Cas system-associated protein Csm6
MKKVFEFLGKLLGVAKGPIIERTIDSLGESLESFAAKKPEAAAALVSSLYVWIDTEVENLAAKSKTDWDDKAVDEAKAELEAFAVRHNLTLTNLDAD